jgi:Bacterial Ig-like domain (group 3)
MLILVSTKTPSEWKISSHAPALTAFVRFLFGEAVRRAVFSDGSNMIGFATLDASGTAVFTVIPGQTTKRNGRRTTLLAKGTHHLTASYSGDGNFAASISAQLTLVVV